MKLTNKSDRMDIEVEGDDVKACFCNTHCGACDSTNVRFVVRENRGFVFHEVRCQECHSALSFGQKREGGALFPKRKSKEGDYLPNSGWVKWQGNDDTTPF
jgi:hypothetical protein